MILFVMWSGPQAFLVLTFPSMSVTSPVYPILFIQCVFKTALESCNVLITIKSHFISSNVYINMYIIYII